MSTKRKHWSTTKPTEPGKYRTRWAVEKCCESTVIVRRVGRGLQVHCIEYNQTLPMSALDPGELEWSKQP